MVLSNISAGWTFLEPSETSISSLSSTTIGDARGSLEWITSGLGKRLNDNACFLGAGMRSSAVVHRRIC